MKKLKPLLLLLAISSCTIMAEPGKHGFVGFSKLNPGNRQMLLKLNPEEVFLELKGDSVTIWMHGMEKQYICIKTSKECVYGVIKD